MKLDMLERHDPTRALRICSALAIVIYSYDILLAVVCLANPASMGSEVAAFYSSELATTAYGTTIRTLNTAGVIVSMALSLVEVRGGLAGLRGHSSKAEQQICLAVSIYCLTVIVLIALLDPTGAGEIVEFGVSGAMAFLLRYYGRRAAARGTVTDATSDDYRKGLKVVGTLLMLFSVLDIAQGVFGFFNPQLLSVNAATLEVSPGSAPYLTVEATLVVGLAISLVQLRLGLLAYEGRTTRTGAWLCLGLFALTAAGLAFKIVSSGLTSLSDFVEVSCAGIMLLYWIYSQRILAAGGLR